MERSALNAATNASTNAPSWRYVDADAERDLRVDFLRGIVMFVLVIIHIEIFSIYNFAAWERIGVVSGAEGFVLLSGYVTGLVSRKRIQDRGWKDATWKLLDRASKLWQVNVFVIFAIALLSFLPRLNLSSIMTFTDRGPGITYPLFPAPGTPWEVGVALALLLKIGPHELQILGLYVCLLVAAPAVLYLISIRRTPLVLALSWIVYFYNNTFHVMPTGAQFENGFPLLTWQLLFVHGLAIGYHRRRVWDFMWGRWKRPIFLAAAFVFVGFLFWAQNTPNPFIPSYARLSFISPQTYNNVYGRFMQKNTLGLLRLVDYASVLIVLYAFLTRCWTPIRKAVGWFFIPLGQASLYVFIMHVPVVAAVNNFLPFGFSDPHPWLWINTAAHSLALAVLWLMVRHRILFRWIPR
jgi:hypothetical protein